MSEQQRPALAESLGLERYGDRGWWFRETWSAPSEVMLADGTTRATASVSLTLMPAGAAARWHRARHDQVWFAHIGAAVLQHGGYGDVPDPGETATLSTDVGTGRVAQVMIPGGEWHRILSGTTDALMSFMSSPGFAADDLDVLQ